MGTGEAPRGMHLEPKAPGEQPLYRGATEERNKRSLGVTDNTQLSGSCDSSSNLLGTKRRHHPFNCRAIALNELAQARFWAKVDRIDGDGCWLWRGSTNKKGYGLLGVNKKSLLAHRVAYTLVNGEIPKGLILDHLCRVHGCCRPSHLEAVTPSVNTARGEGWISLQRFKTHCDHGHEFTPQNTYVKRGLRQCRECNRRIWRDWYYRNKEVAQ